MIGGKIFECTIPGPPVGKERPRQGRNGVYTPKKTRAWESRAADIITEEYNRCKKKGQRRPPLTGPLDLEVVGVKRRPQKGYPDHPDRLIWRTVVPDADNPLKAGADALEKALVVKNDKEFSKMAGLSAYGPVGAEPYVLITIKEAEGVGP